MRRNHSPDCLASMRRAVRAAERRDTCASARLNATVIVFARGCSSTFSGRSPLV